MLSTIILKNRAPPDHWMQLGIIRYSGLWRKVWALTFLQMPTVLTAFLIALLTTD